MATIGKTIKILGDVSGAQDLVVEGQIEGTVQFRNNRVVIAAEGTVKGDLFVANAEVNGHLTGNIIATEGVQLGKSAVTDGKIFAPKIALADGGRFNGLIETKAQADLPDKPH